MTSNAAGSYENVLAAGAVTTTILINGTEAIRVNPNGIPASSIGFTPSGNIAASNVQAALQGLSPEHRQVVVLREFGGLAREVREQVPLTVVFADVRSALSGGVYQELLSRWKAAGLGEQEKADRSYGGHLMTQLTMDAPRTPPNVEVSSEALAAILYTS